MTKPQLNLNSAVIHTGMGWSTCGAPPRPMPSPDKCYQPLRLCTSQQTSGIAFPAGLKSAVHTEKQSEDFPCSCSSYSHMPEDQQQKRAPQAGGIWKRHQEQGLCAQQGSISTDCCLLRHLPSVSRACHLFLWWSCTQGSCTEGDCQTQTEVKP